MISIWILERHLRLAPPPRAAGIEDVAADAEGQYQHDRPLDEA